MAKAILGYFHVRGRAQSIRLLLEYTKTDYIEKTYKIGPPPHFSREEWLNEKFNLGLDFPNLPYYIDGDRKLTQSSAILKYVARKTNMVPHSEEETSRVDLIEYEIADLRALWRTFVHLPREQFDKKKETYVTETLNPSLSNFSKFLGNHKWFAGEKLTYVDFVVYEIFDIHRRLYPFCLQKFPNLSAYMDRFEALPEIKKFMESDRFIKYPIHGPLATFGGM